MTGDECYFCIRPCDGRNKTGRCPEFTNVRNGEWCLPIENDPLELGKRRLLTRGDLYYKFQALYDPGADE